ncbi:MAG TPA: hypothetical protein VIL36_15645 [Acidimicrobiales bacterium]
MTLWLAAAGLVVVAVGLVIVAGRGDDDVDAGLPALPIGSGASRDGAGDAVLSDADAESARADIALLPFAEYVPGDGLPALGGEAPAYRLGGDSGAVDADDVAELARALGIEGEPTESGGSWHVEDGERALDVYGAEGSWSTYALAPDTGTSGGPASLPGAAPDATDGAEVDSHETEAREAEARAIESREPAVEAQAEPVPLPEPMPVEPYEPPVRPDDLPSEDEARSIALDLLEATGVDTDDAAVTVDDGITEWFVTVEPRLHGLPAPGLAMYVGVGGEGAITMASGYLADPVELGEYPLLDTTAALERLNEQYAGVRPLVAASDGDTAVARDAADAGAGSGDEPGMAADSAVTIEPGEVTTEPVIPRDPGEDLPVLTVPVETALPPDTVVPPTVEVAPPPTEPATTVPGEPGPTEPAPSPDPAPTRVAVTDAELVLLMEFAWDGSGAYLVPGYRFTAEDVSSPVVTAVVDELVEPPPTDLPVDDVVDLPADGVVVDGDTPVSDTPGGGAAEPAVEPDGDGRPVPPTVEGPAPPAG